MGGRSSSPPPPPPPAPPPKPVATKAQTAQALELAGAKRARRGAGGFGRGLMSEEELKKLGRVSTLS